MTTKHATKHATKHTCGGPVFGRQTPGCPRCDELASGAQPVQWAAGNRKADEMARIAAIRQHDCRQSCCGPVCTAFDW